MRQRRRIRCGFTSLALAVHCIAGSALAQDIRPGDRVIQPPPPEGAHGEGLGLPSLEALPLARPEAARGDLAPLSAGFEVLVHGYRFEGSSAFSDAELAEVAAPFAGRRISQGELNEVRDAVTRLYVSRGYLTSGAVIPDQALEDDAIVTIRVIEGELEAVRVEGTASFEKSYFGSRLRRAGRAPLDVYSIEETLRRLQQHAGVRRIRARLAPGSARGKSILLVDVVEANRVHYSGAATNNYSPAIGGEGGEIAAGGWNLMGRGDLLTLRFDFASGLLSTGVRYEVPITSLDTMLGAFYRYSHSKIVEGAFDPLDIQTTFQSYGLSLDQPVYRSRRHSLWLGAVVERRSSFSAILGERFVSPDDDVAIPIVAVARLNATWTWRRSRDAIGVYAMTSVGFDAFGSSIAADPREADSEFVSFFGQAQWARLFFDGFWQSRLVLRTNAQLSANPLLSMEKFAVGGVNTIRGYPQNVFVRDNGGTGSIEFWLPLWRDRSGNAVLQIAPFYDIGHVWDDPGRNLELPSETLSSVGIGVRIVPFPWGFAEFYWGNQIQDVELLGDDVQNHGFHFAVRLTRF